VSKIRKNKQFLNRSHPKLKN